jgi:hypothetical protein
MAKEKDLVRFHKKTRWLQGFQAPKMTKELRPCLLAFPSTQEFASDH